MIKNKNVKKEVIKLVKLAETFKKFLFKKNNLLTFFVGIIEN